MNLILSMWMNAVSQPKPQQPVVTEGREEMAALLARLARLAEIDRMTDVAAREEAVKQLN